MSNGRKAELIAQGGSAGMLPGDVSSEPAFWSLSAAFLKVSSFVVLTGAILFDAILFIFTPEQTARAIAVTASMVVTAVTWMLVMRGKVKAAAMTLGVGGWVYITVVSYFFGGLSGTSVCMYPLTIVLAGWLIGTRAAIVVAALTAITTFTLLLLEVWGMLPMAPVSHPAMRWVVQCCTLIISATIIFYVVRSYNERIEEIHRLGSDLARRTSALQAIESDLNRAQAVARTGSWTYDVAADRMTLSKETCRIFGLRRRTTGSYRTYRLRVHPDDQESADALWQAALKSGAPFDNEHRIVIGRTIRWVRQRAEFEFDGTGKPVRAVGTTQDVTDRKRAELEKEALETQLRESQKLEALGTLAGGIAHDFNNVLATITGNAVLARADAGPGHPALQSLDEIDKAAERAKKLVQQILMFGRRQSVQRKCIALEPVLEESMRLLRATQPAGVKMTLHCAPDTPLVMADGAQIEQVVVNLVTNAWHATEGGAGSETGVVDVRLCAYLRAPEAAAEQGMYFFSPMPPGHYACLSVRDYGAGMDEQTQRRIFEPFYTTKEVGKGTGLGLAVVHGISQRHDAVIAVASRPGQGTTVCVYFPAAGKAAGETSGLSMQIVHRDFQTTSRGKSILYIDDDDALVFLVTRLLERRGYVVSGYTDPLQALAVIRTGDASFDLAVTDYNMPGCSGLTVARELKAMRKDMPVAMVSGYLTDDLREKALAAGVCELIYKPESADVLCDAVARLVSA